MSSRYRPLKRDRSAELQRLADRVGELVNGGFDRVAADDVYRRMAKSWDRVPPTGVEDLEAMQAAILGRMATGAEDADQLMRIYEYHADQLRQDYQRMLAVKDAEQAGPPPPPTRGQQAAALGAGVVTGWAATRLAGAILSDVLKPLGTLARLFK